MLLCDVGMLCVLLCDVRMRDGVLVCDVRMSEVCNVRMCDGA